MFQQNLKRNIKRNFILKILVMILMIRFDSDQQANVSKCRSFLFIFFFTKPKFAANNRHNGI